MTDQFEPGYRMLVVACKSDKRWFDLDAVRTEYNDADDATRSRFGGKKLANADVNFTVEGSYDRSYAGAPPLDYWLIDTQAGVERVLKSMLPERVCKICGEPSRRIVGETRYESTVGGRVVLNMQEGERLAENVNQWKGEGGRPGHFVKVNDTLGWSDCGCRCGDCLACSEGPDSEFPCIKKWRAGCVLDPFDLTTEGTNMGEARYIIGDVFDALATLPDNSVDLIFSSPPFLALRSYLPADHPAKAKEIGSEATPADFLDTLLDVVEACDRVLAPHGSLVFELGDTFAGSGGAGGDYNEGGLREGQPTWIPIGARGAEFTSDDSGSGVATIAPSGSPRSSEESTRGVDAKNRGNTSRGTVRSARENPGTWPLSKSLCGIPTLFAWSLAYGRNLLRPERETPRWRIRNLIVWARPNPPVGALGDKFRPATSYLTVACKSDKRWFDLDAVRTELKHDYQSYERDPESKASSRAGKTGEGPRMDRAVYNPAGAPPLDYWEIPTHPFPGAHYATFPPALCIKPIKAMCPERVCRVCGEPSRRIVEATKYACRPEAEEKLRTGTPKDWESDRLTKPNFLTEYETLGWTDCGHDNYRAGVVLDPFAGSGTTLAVATGHGRDAIGIDLDARNFELARERVGPMFLPEPEFVGEPFQFPKVEDVQTDAEVL